MMGNFFDQNLKFLLQKSGLTLQELASEISVSLNENKYGLDDLIKVGKYFNLTLDNLLKKDLSKISQKRSDIKLLILDVDGVLTTGGMYFTEKGDEIKQFNTKDGRGIISFAKSGGTVGIISSGFKKEIIEARSKMLGIQRVHVGTEKKEDILTSWMKEMKISWEEVAFVGDDINDLKVMEKVGLSACPNDAVDEIKAISDIILNKDGGKGCVREFIGNYLHEVKL